ncbi:MAG: hypothetical protein JEY97_06920 [Bacteroidales bacterium]|nr:hypothetical protein [Bacteroidales bacterium]
MKETFSKIGIFKTFFYILLVILISSCKKDSIEKQECSLIFPNGGEWLLKGNEYNIKWFDNDALSVKIELYKSGEKVKTIINSTDNSGEYLWNIPESIDNSNDYKIKISNVDDENFSDQSNSFFTIMIPNETSSFTDSRDGQKYKTVKIGNQWWMAENFNYETESGSCCYLHEETFCAERGKLYTWEAAMEATPEGWHFPTDDDWKTLELFLGLPSSEIDKTGFRGNSIGYNLWYEGGTGFEVLPSGYHNERMGKFGHIGYETRFWTSSKVENEEKYWVRLFTMNRGGVDRHIMDKEYSTSIRFIKNSE